MSLITKITGSFKKKTNTFAQMIGLSELTSETWGKTDQLAAYRKSAYVYSCVRLRSEKVGMVKFTLKRRGSDKEILEHQLFDLLKKPNKFQNGNEFFENYQMHKDLTGSVFVYMLRTGEEANGKIQELHLLRPDNVNIKLDSAGDIVAFEYKTANGTMHLFRPEEILYSISPSPFSPLVGQSPLEPGQQSVDTELQLSQYQNKVIKNGGKVEGILSFKTEFLTEDQVESVKRKFKEHYAEAKNAGKPLVLAGDAEYKNLGLTPTEMSYIESKRLTRDDILLLYRVPKPLLAQTDDVNLANAKMAKSIFLSETIKPLLQNLTQKFNEFLVPPDLVLGFVDPTPEDIDQKLKELENGIKNYYMTPNEAREAQGYDPIPGGDEILVPFNLMPLGKEKPTEKAITKDSQYYHPNRDEEVRKRYAENWIKVSDKREDQFIKRLNKYWAEQKGRLIEKLEAYPKQRRKGLLDESWNVEIEVGAAKEWVLPLIREYLVESGEDTMALFGGGEFSLTSTLQTTLEQKAEIFARSINETTFKTLQKQFAESIEAGENRKQLVKRIKETYGDISDGRAATIARTEVTSASQSGIMAGYEQAGVQIKIWVATPDSRTRDTHASIDGEERQINQVFSNGLMYPGDPSGPASETINCRCSV